MQKIYKNLQAKQEFYMKAKLIQIALQYDEPSALITLIETAQDINSVKNHVIFQIFKTKVQKIFASFINENENIKTKINLTTNIQDLYKIQNDMINILIEFYQSDSQEIQNLKNRHRNNELIWHESAENTKTIAILIQHFKNHQKNN